MSECKARRGWSVPKSGGLRAGTRPLAARHEQSGWRSECSWACWFRPSAQVRERGCRNDAQAFTRPALLKRAKLLSLRP